jgi:putative hydrolase of the HAD superfamily
MDTTGLDTAGNPVKGIVVDYGGVLMRTLDKGPRNMIKEMYDLDDRGLNSLVFGNPLWKQAQLGAVTSEELWAGVGTILHLTAGEKEEFRRRFWSGDRLNRPLVDLIQQARLRGIRSALLSNAADDLTGHLETIGLTDIFDSIVVSAEVGLMKPDPRIYHLVLDELRLLASEAVFVDDEPANVQAARDLGMTSIRFTDNASCIAALEGLLGLSKNPTDGRTAAQTASIDDGHSLTEESPQSSSCRDESGCPA